MYVSSSKASQYYGVTGTTLIRWANSGKINSIRTPGGDFRYWIEDKTLPIHDTTDHRHSYIYARVSTYRQKDDLQRQMDYLLEKYPQARVEQDIGSGLGFHRKGIQKLLELILMGQVSMVIVTHKDRISRFNFELFQWLCQKNNTSIVVDHEGIQLSTRDELTEDLLAITHSFSSRMYGNRKFGAKVPSKTQKQEDAAVEHGPVDSLCICQGDSTVFDHESKEISV
jgi:predicted site-specific integrase-resolvase